MGSLSLDRDYFCFLMILKETLTFLSLSNPILQHIYSPIDQLSHQPTLPSTNSSIPQLIHRPTPPVNNDTGFMYLTMVRCTYYVHVYPSHNNHSCRWYCSIPHLSGQFPMHLHGRLPLFTHSCRSCKSPHLCRFRVCALPVLVRSWCGELSYPEYIVHQHVAHRHRRIRSVRGEHHVQEREHLTGKIVTLLSVLKF